MKCFWIATTARTGSNFFCDLLYERAEIQTPKEFLNHEFLRRHHLIEGKSRLLIPSLDSLLDHIGHQWQNTEHPVCIKALYSQFDAVRTLPGVRESLGTHPVVMLVRRDIVAQGVSQHIARSTGRWVSGALPRRDVPAVLYDFGAIDAVVERIERHNAEWRSTFLAWGIDYTEIVYEQLSARRAEVVDSVIELWRLKPRAQLQAVRKPHASQTTEVNAQFIEQYRRDKAKAIVEPGVSGDNR